MRIALWIIAISLFSATAQAAQIRDLSLSPAESFKQPDISNNQVQGLGGSQAAGTQLPLSQDKFVTKQRFMDTYCDPALSPPAAGSDALSACLKKTREEACARFQRLPEDAQTAVDQKITCTNNFMRADDGSTPDFCKSMDAGYVQVLEKHGKDTDVVYGMAAIPRMVNDPVNLCTSTQ